jgi:hypothetical protein
MVASEVFTALVVAAAADVVEEVPVVVITSPLVLDEEAAGVADAVALLELSVALLAEGTAPENPPVSDPEGV